MSLATGAETSVSRACAAGELELSVVLPCLNEARTVGQCVDKAHGALVRLGVRGEVIVADNGSTDESAEIAAAHGARVVYVGRRGYGSALQGGIAAAGGRYVLMGDADDSYDFSQPDAILERLRAGDDLVVGNRFRDGIEPGAMPWLHRYVGNPLLSGLLNLLFATPVGDAHCGLRGMRREAYDQLGLAAPGMEFASEMVVKAAQRGQRISEVPTRLYPDGRGRPSHLRSFRDGWRHVFLLFQLCPRARLAAAALAVLGAVLFWLFLPATTSAVRDAVVAPCWVLANVLLASVGWQWARRLFPQDGYLELIGHTIVFGWGAIVVAAVMLGGIGEWLSGAALLLAVSGLAVAALAVHRIRPSRQPVGAVPLDRAEAWWLSLWAVLFGAAIGHVITAGVAKFPSEFDSLAYHIPLVDQWIQARGLAPTGCNRWFSPGNNELLAFWSVAPFSGDFLVALNNLPAFVLFAAAGVMFATAMGLPRPLAHLAGLALVCHHVAATQLLDNENDVAVAACFLATLAYAFRYCKMEDRQLLAAGAISLGLLAGVKYYALGYAVLAFGLWLVLAALAHGFRTSLRVLLAVGVGALAFGSYWYLRNWAMTGSPVYPKEFFKDPDLLMQICPFVGQTSFFGNGKPELFGLYTAAIWKMTGPCQLAGFLLAPVSLAWLLGSAAWRWFRSRDAGQARMRVGLALFLAGTAVLLGITRVAVEDVEGTLNQLHWGYCPVRYGLCFLSVVTVAALVLLRDLLGGRRDRKHALGATESHSALGFVTGTVLGGAIVLQLYWAGARRANWLDSVLIGFDLMSFGLVVLLLRSVWPRLGTGLVRLLVVAALPLSAWACCLLSASWHGQFTAHYLSMDDFGALNAIEKQAASSGTMVVLNIRSYAFFGSYRQHHVRQPVYVHSAAWLMDYLEHEQADYVMARVEWPSNSPPIFHHFDECLALHPERFRVLETNGSLVTAQVIRPGGARTTPADVGRQDNP